MEGSDELIVMAQDRAIDRDYGRLSQLAALVVPQLRMQIRVDLPQPWQRVQDGVTDLKLPRLWRVDFDPCPTSSASGDKSSTPSCVLLGGWRHLSGR
jgi:hypothetical protein